MLIYTVLSYSYYILHTFQIAWKHLNNKIHKKNSITISPHCKALFKPVASKLDPFYHLLNQNNILYYVDSYIFLFLIALKTTIYSTTFVPAIDVSQNKFVFPIVPSNLSNQSMKNFVPLKNLKTEHLKQTTTQN